MPPTVIPVSHRLPESYRVAFVIKDLAIPYTGRIRGFVPPNFYLIELDNRIEGHPYSTVIQPASALLGLSPEQKHALNNDTYESLSTLNEDMSLASVLGSFLPIPATAKHTLSGAVNIFIDGKPICLKASEKYSFPGQAAATVALKFHLLNLFRELSRNSLFTSNSFAERDRIYKYLLTSGRLEYRPAVVMPSASELLEKSKRDFWKERNSRKQAKSTATGGGNVS